MFNNFIFHFNIKNYKFLNIFNLYFKNMNIITESSIVTIEIP